MNAERWARGEESPCSSFCVLRCVFSLEVDLEARIAELAQRVLAGNLLDRDEVDFLAGVDGDGLYDLFYWANRIRIRFVGRDVKFCAIVAAKAGGCSEDCKFCAQSSHFETAVGEQTLDRKSVV